MSGEASEEGAAEDAARVEEGPPGAEGAGPPGAGAGEQPSGPPSWDELASWWRETFTHGADLEYEYQILPLAAELLAGHARVLDLGTGEGQLARRLVSDATANGRDVTVLGIDSAIGQVRNAHEEGGGPLYLQGRGEALPFPDKSIDAVVCCLVIEHAEDADELLAEVGRVLAGGGRFLLLINHPIVQGPGSGLVDDTILGERYWRIGKYLPETVNLEKVDSGVEVAFAHRPLSRYINPLAGQGLYLVRMEEPEPPFEFLCGSIDMEFERAMPRLCVMVFERR